MKLNPMSISVGKYWFAPGARWHLEECLDKPRGSNDDGVVIFIVDPFFQDKLDDLSLPIGNRDQVHFIDISHEPTTDGVDQLVATILDELGANTPCAVVGIGGGSTLDTAKAVSNLLTNGGRAEEYQGWDLVRRAGIYKIGIPTVSGTGAEASRTCVMMNEAKNLKLGMNSPHTVFDALILDPDLSISVPDDQYFATGMDTYIHCLESLSGQYRHLIADALSREAMEACRQVFLSGDMKSNENREALMAASFLGGTAIGNSFVGLVHPLSAALSMVLGVRHCIGNCLVLNVLDEFYPDYVREFHEMLDACEITLPQSLCAALEDSEFDKMYEATVVHDKPLINALGTDFGEVLTPEKIREIFRRI